jgi:peptidoglycan glycosyltransferase
MMFRSDRPRQSREEKTDRPWYQGRTPSVLFATLAASLAAIAIFAASDIHGQDPTPQATDEETTTNTADATDSADISFPISDETLSAEDPREERDNRKVAFNTPFGQLSWKDLVGKIRYEGGKAYADHNGLRLQLSISPELQSVVEKQLAAQRYVSGSIVMVESGSGRILAMAERRGDVGNPLLTRESISVSARAPAASLMKIVTAAATIEKNDLNPFTEVPFHGGCGNLRGQNWLRDSRTDRQSMTFALAFGKSCNTVFARLAIYEAGLSALKESADRFHFNKPIPSDIIIETSAAFIPSSESATPYEVGLMGAGFGASALSPIHSAMLSATVGNGGILMAPYLVDAAINARGETVYQGKPHPLVRVFSAETAKKMAILMQETITAGTSRRYFRRKGTRQDLFDIGGKTGTLSDPESRQTLYTWFSGIAPLDTNSGVAIGTLVANPQNWVVRATSLAQASLAHYLKMEKRTSRVARSGNPE